MDGLDLKLEGSSVLNYNSIETLPGYEARAALTVNSSFRGGSCLDVNHIKRRGHGDIARDLFFSFKVLVYRHSHTSTIMLQS